MPAIGRDLDRQLRAIGWGLFFLWIGLALLGGVGWGIGLLGVGVIIVGEQLARKYFHLRSDSFWAAIGVLFVVGGLWELFGIQVGLGPILCILVGIALLFSPLLARRRA
jgi:hypothetical protein